MQLADKVVIVTGAGNGIGAATARKYAEQGARVVLVDWHEAQVKQVAEAIGTERATAFTLDVTDADAVQALMDKVAQQFGGIDIVVNNAGIHQAGTVLNSDISEWKRVAAVDIDGVIYCSKFALPHLLKRKGNIVNVASISGLGGDWGAAYYCTAKGAVVNLTRAMALDHGAAGVRINAVCPGLVRTDMTNAWPEAIRARFAERIPMGRPGEPDEIANAILFVSSPLASFMNGANMVVDGGTSASDGQPKVS